MEESSSVSRKETKSIFEIEDDEVPASNQEVAHVQNQSLSGGEESEFSFGSDKSSSNTSEISSAEKSKVQPLSSFQKAKIEQNRQRALLLRQARLQAHPYKNVEAGSDHSVIRVQNSRLIDTGGGFLIEEKALEEEQSKEVVITEDPAPIIIPERPHCEECEQPIYDSFLYRSFSYPVCDSCKDDEDKHCLITRTDARQEYLLKDCDLDLREPVLRYILKKNPHNPRWGDMKLYLRSQVEDRALEIWETPEKLEEEREIREQKKEKSKVKKFNKQVKTLRMAVRSSVYKKPAAGHKHEYGAEGHDAERDIYYRTCNTCSHRLEYEKM